MSQQYKYWAFISYSHSDAKFVQRLHKQLETFPVPRNLIGKDTERGYRVPKRMFPIFRDREELPGSSNLADNINTALEQSRYLIVICSPRSAVSQWVNQEVMAFKGMGRADRVLCVIIDGEPNATDKPESGLLECFPPGVRYEVGTECELTDQRAEPIAADAREGKDGRKDSLIKLASGLLGVGFNVLKKREQIRVRRKRLLYAAASLMLSAGIVGAGHKIWKEQQRADQNAESTQAVLKFLLDDLLSQADSRVQADSMIQSDSRHTADPNLTLREALDRAAERIEGRFDDKPWVEASIQSVIGKTYSGLGDDEKGLIHSKRAFDLSTRHAGPEAPATIEDMQEYGVMLMYCADFKEALLLLGEALTVSEKVHGPGSSQATGILESIAVLNRRQGNFDESVKLYRMVLKQKTALFGISDRRTINTQNSLAIALRNKGQSDEAEAVYRQALSGLTESLGPAHPDVLVVMSNLGVLLRKKGDLKEAEALARLVMETQEEIYGFDHNETLSSYLNLGTVLYDQGKIEDALEVFNKVLQIRESKLGFDHPDCLNVANNYAVALINSGDISKAEVIFKRVLESRERVLGMDHPITITSVNNLASMLAMKGKIDQARELYERALSSNEKKLGNYHPQTMNSLANLYNHLVTSGAFKDGEPLIRRKYLHDKEALGVDAQDSIDSAQALAYVLSRMDRAGEAVQILSEHAKGSQRLWKQFRYNIACYQCLAGNANEAKKLIAEEVSSRPERKQEAIKDEDLSIIHDFIRGL